MAFKHIDEDRAVGAALLEQIERASRYQEPITLDPSAVADVHGEIIRARARADQVDERMRQMPCKPMVPGRGGWSDWQEPTMKQYFMQCCDCGLVHEMQFKAIVQMAPAAADGTWPSVASREARKS